MKKIDEIIEIDGSQGEGGGQILRTSLSLSMITGKPVKINNIRARRQKAGLLRQHLTAVLASAKISNAVVDGAELHSLELFFKPKTIKGGCYEFSIGSAGSTTLVLQTILPALFYGDTVSEIVIKGGTHNPLAPPIDFLQLAWLPLLRKMGANIELTLDRYGFMPAGGGVLRAMIVPTALQPIDILGKGPIHQHSVTAIISGLPRHIAERELLTVQRQLHWEEQTGHIIQLVDDVGVGNALIIQIAGENVTEVFSSLGAVRLSAEKVANIAIREADSWLTSQAAVGEYLADQLLVPMALAGKGSFTCTTLSDHLTSNAQVIEKFLPVTIDYTPLAENCIQVDIQPRVSFDHNK